MSNTKLMPSIDKIGAGTITIDGKPVQGGLYPDGLNVLPTSGTGNLAEYANTLQRTCKAIAELDRVVFIGLGASNTAIEMAAFMELAYLSGDINDNLEFVNACKGGIALNKINDVRDRYVGQYVVNALQVAGFKTWDPTVAWLKTDDLVTDLDKVTFEEYVESAVNQYIEAIKRIKRRLNNLELLYLTSRNTTRYVDNPKLAKHMEPRAFYSQFIIKKLIQLSIDKDPRLKGLPLLAWGPLFYSEGTIPNTFAHTWEINDVKESDHLHPNMKGSTKMANYLFNFFSNNAYSGHWFNLK